MKKIILFTFALLALQACDSLKTKWEPLGEPGVFQMQVPDYLKPDKTLKSEASTAMSDETKGVYMTVLHESRDTLISYGYPDIDLDKYIALVKESHKISGTTLNFLNERNATVNGMKAREAIIEYDVTAENNGVKTFAKGKLMYVEGKKHFFQVFTWCSKDDYDKYVETFDKMINSFKEVQ
jgi:hypothetical protein